MKILKIGALIGLGAYVLMNWPALVQFGSIVRAVGPGFGW